MKKKDNILSESNFRVIREKINKRYKKKTPKKSFGTFLMKFFSQTLVKTLN